jgi:hypothetical protein
MNPTKLIAVLTNHPGEDEIEIGGPVEVERVRNLGHY